MKRNLIIPIDQVCQLYSSGKSLSELAKIFECSTAPIRKILKEENISMRRKGSRIIYTDVDTSFFSSITNEKNAYFLGFLYADGCIFVKNNSYSIKLELKEDDLSVLKIFRDIISPTSPIKISKRKSAIFTISQKIVAEQLISLGCTQKKSLTLTFPNKLPNHLLSHFMRGYSDGDGCIHKQKSEYGNFTWDFISTKQFCEHFAMILSSEMQIKPYVRLCKPKTNHVSSRLTVWGNEQVEKILDWLYRDATIYLDRKYQKYLELKNLL